MIRIQVYRADQLESEFESADAKEIAIGRAQGCAVRLDDPKISRLHIVLLQQSGGWILQRKANFGAVLMNGQEVENASLEGGEEIQVGDFSLRVQIDAAQPTSQTGGSNARALEAAGDSSVSVETSEDGRTRFVQTGASALFRVEPGGANVDEFLMEKDVAVFGRGSNCDVVLTEKKASRKHFEVRRQGLSFFLKDLNSANGTLVNGASVTETELVAGDTIQVGESKIQFSVEHKDFFARQDQFLPVPAHLTEAAAMEPGVLGGGMELPAGEEPPLTGTDASADLGPDGTPLPPKPTSSTDFIGLAKYKWAKIPKAQRMRYLTILVVFCLIGAFLEGPDDDSKKPKPPPPRDPNGRIVRRFEDLTEKNKKFVKENYKELLEAHEKKEYNKMSDAARNILTQVDEYNDTKRYEAIAKRGIEQIEEERKRRENEERQKKIAEEVAKLEDKGEEVFQRALKDPKARDELNAVIEEIYAKSPSNRRASEWKQKIKEAADEEKRATELARQREELKQKAEDHYAQVEKIYKDEKFLEAIKEADKLTDDGWTEKEYLDRVEKLKTDIRSSLKNVLDPLLAEARTQRQDGGDLVKAREKYKEVLRIDTKNEEALRGIRDVRGVLVMRARRFYNQAILAESLSDLTEAKVYYEKCLHTAPDDLNLAASEDYAARCKRKLVRFDAFSSESPGRN